MNSHDTLRNEIYDFYSRNTKEPDAIYVSGKFYYQLLKDCVGFSHMSLAEAEKPCRFMGITVYPVNSNHHPEISIR